MCWTQPGAARARVRGVHAIIAPCTHGHLACCSSLPLRAIPFLTPHLCRRRPPIADRRSPTADRRPLTADRALLSQTALSEDGPTRCVQQIIDFLLAGVLDDRGRGGDGGGRLTNSAEATAAWARAITSAASHDTKQV